MCVLNRDKLIWFVHTVKWIACSCHRFSYSLCSLYFICRMLCVLPCCIGAFEIFSLIYSFIYIGTLSLSFTQTLTEQFIQWNILHDLKHLRQLSPSFLLTSVYLDDGKIVTGVLQYFTPPLLVCFLKRWQMHQIFDLSPNAMPWLSVTSDWSNSVSSLQDEIEIKLIKRGKLFLDCHESSSPCH